MAFALLEGSPRGGNENLEPQKYDFQHFDSYFVIIKYVFTAEVISQSINSVSMYLQF